MQAGVAKTLGRTKTLSDRLSEETSALPGSLPHTGCHDEDGNSGRHRFSSRRQREEPPTIVC